jgi:hypothetical protein
MYLGRFTGEEVSGRIDPDAAYLESPWWTLRLIRHKDTDTCMTSAAQSSGDWNDVSKFS